MNIEKLKHILPFSDNEIAVMSSFVVDYYKDNKDTLTKDDCFKLGGMVEMLQFNFRLIKGLIEDTERVGDKETVTKFLEMFLSFGGLPEYLKTKMEDTFEKLPHEQKYKYLQEVPYSYFSSECSIEEYDKDIEKLIKKLKKT